MESNDADVSPRRESLWRRVRWSALAVVALLVVVGVVKVVMVVREPGPEDVVRQFLTAVQQRQVDKALSLVKATNRPTGEAARFLTGAAIASGWRIVKLELDYPVDLGDTSANVEVWLANGYLAEDGSFRVSKVGGKWWMDDPFLSFPYWATPLWYLDVNGMRLPKPVSDRTAVPQSYLLFPGAYHFYRDITDLVDVTSEPVTLLPGGDRHPEQPEVMPTAKALLSVQQAVNAHIDQCAKRITTTNVGCPFGVDLFDDHFGVRDAMGGEDSVRDVTDVRWRVLRYPTVALTAAGDAFAINTTVAGLVQLTGAGLNRHGQRISFSATCAITGAALVAGVTAAGGMAVVPPAVRYGDSAPVSVREDCRRP